MRPIAVVSIVVVVVAAAVGVGFELSNSSNAGASTSTNASTAPSTSTPFNVGDFCLASTPGGRPNLGWVSPLRNGSIVFIKVVTDQDRAIVNNGSIFVTHTSPLGNGTSTVFTTYCMHLMPNATGFMPLSTNDSLPQGGRYGIKMIAGYDGGKSFQAVDPGLTPGDIVVSRYEVTSFTVSIPSAQMTTATCSAGSCQTTITTTIGTTTASLGASSTVNTSSMTATVTQTITVQETAATTTVTSCSNPVSTVTVTLTATSYSQASTTVTTTLTTTVTSYGTITVTKTDCAGTTRTVITITTVTR